MKKLFGVMIVTTCLSSLAYAVAPGGYFGANAGMSSLESQNPDVLPLVPGQQDGSKKTSSGFGGGLFLGANINNYAGLELGVNHYANVKNSGESVCAGDDIQTNALNVLGKGMIPFGTSGLTLIGKGGVAAVRTTGPGEFHPTTGKCSSESRTDAKPTIAIGASLDMSQTWVAEVSYSRIFVNNDFLKSANMISLGISYHFVDVYCGQFLC